jgi:hypothetical protein
MENKKFLSQANELGPNHGKAIRTETERKNLGIYRVRSNADINRVFWISTSVVTALWICLLVYLL